jgi:choline dehydrogenase-like flavoprotein
MNTTYDYLIIGSGAGGSAAAYALAKAGKSVLLIEKGEPLPKDGSTLDIDQVIRRGRFKSKEPWLDKVGRQFVPEEYFNLGGKTKWYGAALLRYDRHEFEAEPEFQCLPWPISYAELEPFYETAETLLGVRRFDMETGLKSIVDKLRKRGTPWECKSLPLGLSPEIFSHPQEARHFDGFASVIGLKADAEHTFLDRVRLMPNLELRTGHAVSELLAAADGPLRLRGVKTQDGCEFHARKVLLAAGALHSPRLVQQYMEFTGLAKRLPSYAQVGRNCKLHLLTALLAFSFSRKTDTLRKTAVLLNEAFPHSSIQPLGFDAETIATLMPSFVPMRFADLNARLAYGFFLQTEDGSNKANRVIAEQNGHQAPHDYSAQHDYPRLDYDPRRLPLSAVEHRRMIRAFRWSLLRAGLFSAYKPIPHTGTAHVCGTMVTGNDPERSVVDAAGRVHGMDNLYVVDGSILPRSSRLNPSLTIYAWALRVAHLLITKEIEHESASAGVHTVQA